ncbi:MAG: hypothetical protein HY000_07735 [Planctomycetes bacterium]|nr:hypothetical protein [Planctomycetota bacterium]
MDGQPAHRNRHPYALTGFGNALLLTGDPKYVDLWRNQIKAVNANAKRIDGRMMYPKMFGDEGWYAFDPEPYSVGALEIYFWSMKREDRERVGRDPWLDFLDGRNPDYPERALRADFARIRERVAGQRADSSTPDTRLADDPMKYNPASVRSLIELMLGGLHPGHQASPLHCRLRYFDPAQRRPGMPEDVGALVEKLGDRELTVQLVNINQSEPRDVIVQTGCYGEHLCTAVAIDGREVALNQPYFRVRLAPGAGSRVVVKTNRYASTPTLWRPWDRPSVEHASN